jgi:4-diphosphocytidyl-2-C-methyl-D-erythritol kinase
MIERAYAKLNLTLDVLKKTSDGYHDLTMIMQSVQFGDDIHIELTQDGSFFLMPGQSYLPADDRNLAMRAAKLFLRGTGLGCRMKMTKRTPVCAGMGGGSSDAAAVLRALNKLTGAKKSLRELQAMAEQLGSDVPFCVQGGTALAQGRGEILTPLPPMPDCPILICKPTFSISTPELFGRIDARKIRLRPDTLGMKQALEAGELPAVARRVYNVFEDVLDRRQAEVFAIKNQLISLGAMGAAMTGTGSAVFALFDDQATATAAHDVMAKQYKDCYLTRPMGQAEIG